MIILDETDNSVEIKLTAAITTSQLQVFSSYVDMSTTATTPKKTDTVTNNTTAVTAVAAPAASTQRIVKTMSVYNADTVSSEVTIQFNNNATLTVLFKGTLQPGEMLCYVDGQGFFTRNPFGGVGTGVISGRLVRAPQIITTGTAATYTRPTGVTAICVSLWGAGGGGGGVDGQGASNAAVGGGGGGGGFAFKRYTNPPATCTYSVGALGAGGVAGNNNGTGGGDTTFTDGTTLVTAKGGSGGTGQLGATTAAFADGGAGGAISTNGDINGAGQPGQPGIRLSGTVSLAGAGGSGPSGGGGGKTLANADADGSAGVGAGSGGSGGSASGVATNRAGGAGVAGLIIIEEYA